MHLSCMCVSVSTTYYSKKVILKTATNCIFMYECVCGIYVSVFVLTCVWYAYTIYVQVHVRM